MRRAASRPVRLAVVLAASVAVAAGCTSHAPTASPRPTPTARAELHLATTSPDPGKARADAATTPAGWRRYEYGPLSVAVPPSWRVNTVDPGSCSAPPSHTVTALRESTVTASSCPSREIPQRPDTTTSVVIQCLVGKANHLFSGGEALRTVDGHTLRQTGTLIYLQGAAAEGVVSTVSTGGTEPAGPDDPGARIRASVEPTGMTCQPAG
jgi:hypothetical protein